MTLGAASRPDPDSVPLLDPGSRPQRRLARLLHGDGLEQRALRGSLWTIVGFGSSQGLRLASNLILTRLLFPEIFGVMALIMVVIQGLNNFSDVGVGPAIMQSRRGDDRDFLNTAFTMQAVRGVMLWLACVVLAVPVARFYDTPELAWYLPVAGFISVINGLLTTRLEEANRHLQLGLLTRIELASSALSIVLTVALAAVMRSAWALVIGMVIGAAIKWLLAERLLPGERNRFRWDRSAVAELVGFGKWIFPSTIVGFGIAQGDRAILGKYLTLDELGIYNIAYFLASFPLQLAIAVIWRLMIPVYREYHYDPSPMLTHRLRRIHWGLTGGFLAVLVTMAALGPWIVALLYDPRYESAGMVLPMIACATIPQIVMLSYDQAALAGGDSRRFLAVTAIRAALFLSLYWAGVHFAGLPGALAGQALGAMLAYPAVVWIARRHRVWDPLHDAVFLSAGALVALLVLWV
ncbi:MAG TPA: oligosaccharide flippase family protein [Paracoccus solventivorans]|uniref:Oligosaccharide flippase family protein n=1 Tax=Paracoccus solventivorans TaxID=53463 RepID=A0A832PKW6_9RHOB|nr:oligosaccharide flippase family protein [Paracoccus solventivorans]HHW33142.1 oligosaccharide flippase family protein [Paracoccus solventivorans]